MIAERRIYRTYNTMDTAHLIAELLADDYYMEKFREEISIYGDFSAREIRHFIHEEFFERLKTSLLDIEWQEVADEINVRF